MLEVQTSPDSVGRKPSIPYEAIGWQSRRTNPTIGEGCPCCGAAMNVVKPRVDLNSNTLMSGNKTVALEPKEALLMDLLLRRAPGTVTRDSLIMYAWPDGEPEVAETGLKVRLCYLRKKAELLGVKIVNVHSVGYRVVL